MVTLKDASIFHQTLRAKALCKTPRVAGKCNWSPPAAGAQNHLPARRRKHRLQNRSAHSARAKPLPRHFHVHAQRIGEELLKQRPRSLWSVGPVLSVSRSQRTSETDLFISTLPALCRNKSSAMRTPRGTFFSQSSLITWDKRTPRQCLHL